MTDDEARHVGPDEPAPPLELTGDHDATAADGDTRGTFDLSRRGFLAGAGAAGAGALYEVTLAHARAITGLAGLSGPASSLIGVLASPVLTSVKLTYRTILRRREDFLWVQVDCYNLRPTTDQRLAHVHGGSDGYVVFTFQPQHITEQAYLLTDAYKLPGSIKTGGETPQLPGRSKALMAYPSRIAFVLPAGKSVPATLAGLLDWAALQPSLVPTAAYLPTILISTEIAKTGPGSGGVRPRPVPAPKLQAPAYNETAIELPWHLVISPIAGSSWSHPSDVIEAGGWTELWHTRLAASADAAADDGGTIRAVWNYDLNPRSRKPTLDYKTPPAPADTPFRTSLQAYDRWNIVNATSNFYLKGSGRADVTADKLWLSARGGFLDSIGVWDLAPSTNIPLEEWKHLATLARDHYVKVVYKGFLFPFGHRVVLTKVTERVFESDHGEIIAASRQHFFLVVREPVKSYTDPSDTFGMAFDARRFPFTRLEIKTLRTPDLDAFAKFGDSGLNAEECFVPTVGGAPFQWHLVGTDWIGDEIAFTAPAVFVLETLAFEKSATTTIINVYNGFTPKGLPVTDARRIGQFTGEEVAFAASNKAGDTSHSVSQMVFGSDLGSGGSVSQYESADQPIFYPNLTNAVVTLSAAAQASGGTPLPSPVVYYHQTFIDNGFYSPSSKTNAGNVYLAIDTSSAPGPALNFGGGTSGGVITPNLSLSGLSRSLGPVAGDLDQLAAGTFDPSSVFQGAANVLDATILGGVKLIDLIQAVTGSGGLPGFSGDSPAAQVLQIAYNTAPSVAGVPADRRGGEERGLLTPPPAPPVPHTYTTNLHWAPDIVGDNPIVSEASTDSNDSTYSQKAYSFTLDGTITADLLAPASSTFTLTGVLTGFVVTLMTNQDDALEFIQITFNELTFNAASHKKPTVHVDIANVGFLGVLAFVEKLEDFMDFSGDGGPKITVTPAGVSADLSVALPPIGVGIFSLSNIGIDAGFNLPFDGSPARFRFSFSTQDNPFTLSVAIFGGGGYFGIAIGTDGVELIQAGFDFGAMASIDLGVASGSVQLVAGIYFSYGQLQGSTQDTCILTGYVKLDGSLSILGIIELTLTFDLSLTYESPPSSVTGTATLSVGIKIFFFSFSVSVTASKTFGGGSDASGGDIRGRLPQRGTYTGDTPPTFATQMDQTDWNNYCAAFA